MITSAWCNDPRGSSPPGRTYTVQYLGNVVDGTRITYLNVDIDMMKDIAMRMLQDGMPVWMGCDTGKQMHRDKGLWDAELFDYGSVYSADFEMNKADRLEYHQTAMTHAMLFTGVDVVDGKPRRWRVENSWDDKVGREGLLPDERLLVRRVHVRDRRAEELPAPGVAGRPGPGTHRPAAVGPDGVAGLATECTRRQERQEPVDKCRHSGESRNPESSAVAARFGYGNAWIPAFAGMTG